MEESVHQTEERLELYALGRLVDPEVSVVEEHLLSCEHCCTHLEEQALFAASMTGALRDNQVSVREPAPSRWFEWLRQPRWAMGGAMAALLVAAGLYWSAGSSRLPAMASLQLTAVRGEMQLVKRARKLNLTVTDAPVGQAFQVDLVDGTGAKVWSAAATAGSPWLEAEIDRQLAPGDYFLRLSGTSGKLLHEYGFRVS